MSLPEPGQPTIQPLGEKKETTVAAAPASTVPVVEDAGQFVSPTVPREVADVVVPTSPMPVVSMPPEVTHAGEGVPVVTGQEAEIPPVEKILAFKPPNLGILGLRAAGSVKKWNEVRAERDRKKGKLKAA